MNAIPISGTMRTENAPPLASAVPYSRSQQPGSRAIRSSVANTGVSTMPATSGGKYASANRYAGAAVDSGVPDFRAFHVIVGSAIATAAAASPNQTIPQRSELAGGPETAAAAIAVAPIATPPQPGMAVNALARVIASRMKRRLSAACASIGSGRAAIESFITQR